MPYVRASWLSRNLASFRLPLQVGEPPDYAFSLLGSTLRSHLKAGAAHIAYLSLRNDGLKTWKKGEVALRGQWYQVEDELDSPSSWQARLLGEAGAPTPITKDVPPGETITLRVSVETAAQGDPLPPWKPGDMWHYGLAWTLEAGGKKIEAPKGSSLEVVYVVNEGLGSYFVDSTTPGEMTAGKEYPVEVVLTNAGAVPWPANSTELVHRWYFWDGTPAPIETASSPLPAEVAAGESLKLSATVKAPSHGGPYHLVWDLKQGECLASASINANTNAILQVPVMVSGGLCAQVDLTDYLNIIAAVSDRRRASGDLDGLGNSFPLESMPPDLSGNALDIYPSGYYVSQCEAGLPLLPQIAFRYPSKAFGLQKALACRGQTIELAGAAVSRLHILGAGTGAGLSGSLQITFADGHTQSLPLVMSSWLEPPSHNEASGFIAPYLRAPRGDNLRQRAYLHHYVLALPQTGEITSITLPNNPEMKIFALTLEAPAEEAPSPQ
jgi:hypothetical protein